MGNPNAPQRLVIPTVCFTDDPETLAVHILGCADLLGVPDSAKDYDGIRRWLMVQCDWTAEQTASKDCRDIALALRLLCVKRGKLDDPNARPAAVVGDFRPGSWFTLNTKIPAARLRMAAREGRLSMHVRKRTIRGTVCYSVSDAERWWPSDMAKL